MRRHRKQKEMKVPVELKPTYWSHVAGVVATFAIGFIWGGWVRGRTDETSAVHGADTAPVTARQPASQKQKLE
jgi:hypothetical protein